MAVAIPDTTLCCIDCSAYELAARALRRSLDECRFENAVFLTDRDMEVAGVEVGRVKKISLKEDRAMVKLAVQNGTKLYSDTIASIKTRGIIGEKYLALSPGGGGDPLKPGDTIRDTESGLDLEELVSQYVHGKVN